jgi:hypothetical protein
MAALAAYALLILFYSGILNWLRDSLLPTPVHAPAISDDDEEIQLPTPSTSLISRSVVPPYGQRKEWKPSSLEDFGELEMALL